jgi:glycosyltransferase involved in cell wall biosynthesis
VGVIKNFLSVKDIVKDNEYKYVLRTSQHSLSALELLAAKLGGAKVRVFRSSNSNTTTGVKKDLVLHNLCKFMPILFANVRIAPSTEAAEFMFGKGCIQNGKAVLIHNAIDTNEYKYSDESRNRIRKEWGIGSELVIGHIGRFNHQKNHNFLIGIFEEILKKNPNSKLVLVGCGELENIIKQQIHEKLIEDNVIFTGVRKDIPELLSAFDVLVFPSLYEGLPNTVIEAQATGLPCIISDTITREVNITGLVKFCSLLETTEKWAELTINSTKCNRENTYYYFIENHYDIDNIINDFQTMIFENDRS